ncbi:hypothetical protein [Phenylobacterium immobile]|uniref:hypothetical protein n=1 Tax=Phenylobacterium immobile TaxID=21 RepID=UPI000B0C86AF|nr:hypothetical protein [Phenylobacterium immobile]
MSAILFPIAANAEQALSQPLGRAARERDAARSVGGDVVFTTEAVGPAFLDEAAALAAYVGRIADPGRRISPAGEDLYLRLAEQIDGRPRRPVEPIFAEGRRWPAPEEAPRTVWRLRISYWRIGSAERPLDAPQARKARRARDGAAIAADTLKAIASQPLRPVKPQQGLDIGLFEVRLPEAPHIIVPDE